MSSKESGRPAQAEITVTIGVSGYLINSDVLLWDRETQTLWSQIDARGIAGPRAGYELTHLPIADTTWQAWKTSHPEGRVLRGPMPPKRYAGGYRGYHDSNGVLFPLAHESDRLPKKSVVTGLRVGGDSACWSHVGLRKRSAAREETARETPLHLTETIGETTVRLTYDPVGDSLTAHTKGERDEDVAVPTLRMYWFAWFAFHPRTLVDGKAATPPPDGDAGD